MTDLALYLVVGALALAGIWAGMRADRRKRRAVWDLPDNWKPPEQEKERQ